MSEALVIAIVLTATAFDALRDVWMAGPRHLRKGWWPRHLAKWVSFYLPLCALLWLAGFAWWEWLVLAGCGWCVWRFFAVKIGGVEWKSWWARPRRNPDA